MRTLSTPAALALGLALLPSCHSLRHDQPAKGIPPEITRVWEKHMRVVMTFAKGTTLVTGADLDESIEFFERHTGILSRAHRSWAGREPNEFFPDDIRNWQRFFRQRGHCLRPCQEVDPDNGELQICYDTHIYPDCR